MYTGPLEFGRKAFIDCGSLFNLIFQSLIEHYSIKKSDEDISLVKDLNGRGIKLFKRHCIAVETKSNNGSKSLDTVDVYSANIRGHRLILGLDWLASTQLSIDWVCSTVYFKLYAKVPE